MTTLEHVGIAVKDPDAVGALLAALLGLRRYKSETVDREQVETHFIGAGDVKLELLEALGPESAVAKFIAKRGPGVHHLAFEVASVEDAIRRGRELGLTPLAETGRPGADRKRVAFFHPRDTYGLLIEVCETLPADIEDPMDDASITAFGVTREPAIVIVCLDEGDHVALWHNVAGLLESALYTVVVESRDGGADDLVVRALGDNESALLVVDSSAADWAAKFAAHRGESVLSTVVCDLGLERATVQVRSTAGPLREFSVPPVVPDSRLSVRLLARLLQRIAEAETG